MSTTRTDIHRPSAIIPADYEYVCCEYTRGDYDYAPALSAERNAFKAHQHSTGGALLHEEGSPCDVCGSPKLIYGMLFHHAPTNAYVRVGEDCAYKLGLGGSAQFNAFKSKLREQAEVYAGKAKAQEILAERGQRRAWTIAFAEDRTGFAYEENTITDIISKLVRYGSVSDRALAYVDSLIEKIDKRAEVATQRAAENAAAADFPRTDARIEIIGTVLTVKQVDSQFGTTWKMLVRADAGWKIWVTAPGNPHKGDRVKFFAAVEPSRDDPKFGFGKRPTKFVVTQEAAQAAS